MKLLFAIGARTLALSLLAVLCAAAAHAQTERVGPADGDRIVVPTNQVLSPAGKQVAFSGRPTDVALSPDGRWLAVLDRSQVAIMDVAEGEVESRVPHASGSY